MIEKLLPDTPKLYILQKTIACVFYSLSYEFYYIGNKIADDHFKDDITPSLKANYRLKFAQNISFNHVRDKVKPRCKL